MSIFKVNKFSIINLRNIFNNKVTPLLLTRSYHIWKALKEVFGYLVKTGLPSTVVWGDHCVVSWLRFLSNERNTCSGGRLKLSEKMKYPTLLYFIKLNSFDKSDLWSASNLLVLNGILAFLLKPFKTFSCNYRCFRNQSNTCNLWQEHQHFVGIFIEFHTTH